MHRMLALIATVEVGGYLAWWKIIPPLLLLFVFARLLAWIDKDTLVARLPREWVNLGMLGGFILGFTFFFLLPNFWLAILVLLLMAAADAGVYILIRQRSVGLQDLGAQFEAWKASFGKSKTQDEEEATEVLNNAGLVALSDKAGKPVLVPGEQDPNRIGFVAAQELLLDPLLRGADRIELSPEPEAASVVFQVDGMPYSAQPMDRTFAAAGVTFLKLVANMDLGEKRKPQRGRCNATVGGKTVELELQTAGNTAGEFLQVIVEPRKQQSLKLDELGMSPQQLANVRALIADAKGIVLAGSPRGHGMRSTLFGIVRGHDPYLTNIHSIERSSELDIEGITQNKLAPNASAADELQMVQWVISQQPDVILMSQVESPNSASALIDYAAAGHRVYAGVRAGNTFEALQQWLKLVGDDRRAVAALRLIISTRVVRRLCTACKVEYRPDAELLRKLNLDPRRVQSLFQARTEPARDRQGNPIQCEFCQELHYKGRFAIFEFLPVDDGLRQIVMRGGQTNELKTAMRASKGVQLQDAAIAAVESGHTSLQEIKRALTTVVPTAQAAVDWTKVPMADATMAAKRSGINTGQPT